MILDLDKFLSNGRPYWQALEELLKRLEAGRALDLEAGRQLHHLYERTSADLARLGTFAAEPETRRYLEGLVGRAYAEIHHTAPVGRHFRPGHWLAVTFPETFRRHVNAFWLAVVITLVGAVFGGVATVVDPESREVTMPFGHDQVRPSDRVRREESAQKPGGQFAMGGHGSFSGYLIQHNTRISILTLSLGMTFGLGTIVMLFYNGIGVGAIAVDYVLDGQSQFLAGWLLPHGSIEIPAILIAGQAGLVLGQTLLGRGTHLSLAARLQRVGPDLVTLIGGVALLLVYAGFIEAFLSQYHEPLIPYSLKIAFGLAELTGLISYLALAGRGHRGVDPSGP